MQKECDNKASNKQGCNCAKTSCENHGVCCSCIKSHRERGSLPACVRHLGK